MSFAEGLEKPLHEALDTPRLFNEHTKVVNVYVYGHFYSNPTINNSGSANLGDLGQMCKLPKRFRRWSKDSKAHGSQKRIKDSISTTTPPHSEPGTGEPDQTSVRSDPDDRKYPPEYRHRHADWFTPGRIFNIWALEDVEIHQKKFVLLDTKNIEGPGLLVHVYDEEEKEANKGYFHRSHVLVQNFEQWNPRSDLALQSKKKTVFMDAYIDERVEERTYIELEHQYNIPFEKYPCIDCGVLDRSSLKHLRRCYLKWLEYHWGID